MSHVGDVRDADDSADWDDENESYEWRVTKLPTYQCTDPVDVRIPRDVLDRMTVGDIRAVAGGRRGAGRPLRQGGVAGNVAVQWELEDEGNMVLNPWYALHLIDVGDGSEIPTWDAVVVRGAEDADNMKWRQPWRGAGQPNAYPPDGRRFYDANQEGDYTFKQFEQYLQAFGYDGHLNFAYKPDSAIETHAQDAYNTSIAGGGTAAQAVAARDAARAEMTGSVAVANDANFRNTVDDPRWDGSLRRHPDYAHPSYRVARYLSLV